MQILEGDIQKADLQPRTNAEVLLKSSVREATVLNELKFERKSQGQEKINFFFHFVWSQENMNLATVLGMLEFFAAGDQVLLRPMGGQCLTGCTVHRVQRETQASTPLSSLFPGGVFIQPVRVKGLMWEGKPKKSQDMERTHPYLREAQKVKCWARHKPALPAASQTFFSSKSWAHINCVSNIKRTR